MLVWHSGGQRHRNRQLGAQEPHPDGSCCAVATFDAAMIEPLGTAMPTSPTTFDDECAPRRGALVDAVREACCKTLCDTASRPKLLKPLPTAGRLPEPPG